MSVKYITMIHSLVVDKDVIMKVLYDALIYKTIYLYVRTASVTFG